MYLTEAAIRQAVVVRSMIIDSEKLPDWEKALQGLPCGTGIKGGVARKILKVLCGRNHNHEDFKNEMNGDGDLDVLIAVSEIDPGVRLGLRRKFAGKKIGDLLLEAKDIEVADSLSWYFLTRDITMNECLLFREKQDLLVLYFSHQGQLDILDSIIRPSVHLLHNGFSQVWKYWQGQPVVGSQNFVRSIVRYLKGHGLRYAIDEHTFNYYHYRNRGLKAVDLWRILRPFHKEQEKYLRAARYLEQNGLIAPLKNDIERRKLWGKVMLGINDALAERGKLLTLADPNAEVIEEWIDYKSQQWEQWQTERQDRIARGIMVTPDIKAEVILPEGVNNFPIFFKE